MERSVHRIDFVLARARDAVHAIECKWDPATFDADALRVFRGYYPRGGNWLVTPQAGLAHVRRFDRIEVTVCGPGGIDIAGQA